MAFFILHAGFNAIIRHQTLEVVYRIVEIEQKIFLLLFDLGFVLGRVAQFLQCNYWIGRQKLGFPHSFTVVAAVALIKFSFIHSLFSSFWGFASSEVERQHQFRQFKWLSVKLWLLL